MQLIISTVTLTGGKVHIGVNIGPDICLCVPADNLA